MHAPEDKSRKFCMAAALLKRRNTAHLLFQGALTKPQAEDANRFMQVLRTGQRSKLIKCKELSEASSPHLMKSGSPQVPLHRLTDACNFKACPAASALFKQLDSHSTGTRGSHDSLPCVGWFFLIHSILKPAGCF